MFTVVDNDGGNITKGEQIELSLHRIHGETECSYKKFLKRVLKKRVSHVSRLSLICNDLKLVSKN